MHINHYPVLSNWKINLVRTNWRKPIVDLWRFRIKRWRTLWPFLHLPVTVRWRCSSRNSSLHSSNLETSSFESMNSRRPNRAAASLQILREPHRRRTDIENHIDDAPTSRTTSTTTTHRHREPHRRRRRTDIENHIDDDDAPTSRTTSTTTTHRHREPHRRRTDIENHIDDDDAPTSRTTSTTTTHRHREPHRRRRRTDIENHIDDDAPTSRTTSTPTTTHRHRAVDRCLTTRRKSS